MGDGQLSFEQLLHDRLIPEFCSKPGRRCEPSGYRKESGLVSEQDARYFVMALNAGLIEHQGWGRYRSVVSATYEQFFWEGPEALQPRPFTLWLEPIITVGGLARLHFDYGWPKHLIGTQSSDWAFDLVAFLPDEPTELIAGEVKKTAKEIERLVQLMQIYGQDPHIPAPSSGKERNAYKKVLALRSRRPPLFWAVGPDGLNEVFRVKYHPSQAVELARTGDEALRYPGNQMSSQCP